MKTTTTLPTTAAALGLAFALAVLPVGAFAQQKAVEQFDQYLQQRDAPDRPSAATEANRHATLRSLEHRIERLEHDQDVGDTPPSVGAAHAGAGLPC